MQCMYMVYLSMIYIPFGVCRDAKRYIQDPLFNLFNCHVWYTRGYTGFTESLCYSLARIRRLLSKELNGAVT